jgi:hypothetical protein
MLVPKQVIAGVLDGRVIAVRVPLNRYTPKTTESLRAAHVHRDENGKTVKVTAGPVICRLRIHESVQVPLEDVTDGQARAEGYTDAKALLDAFRETYQAGTGTNGWWISLSVDRAERPRVMRDLPWTPATEDGQYRRQPEPEQVDPKLATGGEAGMRAQQRWNRDRLQTLREQGSVPLGERIERELAAAREAGVETARYEHRIQAALRSLEARRRAA